MGDFYDSWLKGGSIKELIKALLENAGYSTFPYGYESTYSYITKKMREKGAKNSSTARRIKSSPDMLVYDDERKDVMLVEVKMRSAPKVTDVTYLRLRRYKDFWHDSILVIVVPCGDVLYAQKINELEIKQSYNLLTEFEKFEDIFTRVNNTDLSKFKSHALEIMKKTP